MYKHFFYRLCIIALMMYATLSCKRRQDPVPVPDTTSFFKADFKIEEQVGNVWMETDSVMQSNGIRFTATADYDSYEWKIGDDARTYTTKSCATIFLQVEGDVNVRLIARGKKNPLNPNDDGIDTIQKTFRVIEWHKSATIGEYEGYIEGRPNDIFRVTIKYIAEGNMPSYFIKNINKGCTGQPDNSGVHPAYKNQGISTGFPGGKGLYFDSNSFMGGNCRAPIGMAKLLSPNKIQIDYTVRDVISFNPWQSVTTTEKFIGNRK